jgi:replicative DNA helicase
MQSRPEPNSNRPPRTTESSSSNGADGAPVSIFDRVLPHDLDAERALLGAMLQKKEAIGEALIVLQNAPPDVFFRESHQQLYALCKELYDADAPLDAILIKDELIRRGLFERLGGYDFLASLVDAVPHTLRAPHYARLVREKHLLRELIRAAHEVLELAFAGKQPPQAILDEAERIITRVTERRVTGAQAAALPDLVMEAIQQIQQRGDGALTGMPTGLIELDELTCGLQPSELIIIAGRPSMGKTAFGLNLAEHMAIVERRPVLFFSLEMSRQQVAQRVLCSRARVDAHRLRRGRHSREDLINLERVQSELAGAPLLVDDSASLSITEMQARSRTAHRKFKIEAIFVDYLQLMRAPGIKERHLEVGAVSQGLKKLAKDLNVPVIAMAQLNRQVEGAQRRGNRPRMSDLRESGAIEQDADVIMLLHRESYYKTPGEETDGADDATAEVIIAKQRNGPTDTVKLHFNRQYTRFDNHHPGHMGDGAPGPF